MLALSNDDDKRIVSLDKITSYPYGYKAKQALVAPKLNNIQGIGGST